MGRAVVFHEPGEPLEVEHYTTPEPRGAEVLVRTTVCALCRSDLHTHAGRRDAPTPTVLGHEIIGRIEAFGPDAARRDANGLEATVGDRVTWALAVGCGRCFYCADDLPQKCEVLFKYGHATRTAERPLSGGLADHVVLVPGTVWFRVPDEVPDRVAVSANCATATVAGLLRHAGPIAGRTVLVLGAGVLGVTACAMARAARAGIVIASDPDAERRRRAERFGATDAPVGRGADVVLELAGVASSVEQALTLARTGGTVILAGTVAPTPGVAFNPESVVRRMLTIRGVHNYHPRDLGAALAFLAGPGRAYPFDELIAGEHPLERAERAFVHAHAEPGRRVLVRAEA